MERRIEIEGVSDELLGRLDERASQIGLDRSSYVRRLIERAVAPPALARTLGDLLAPVHDSTDVQGILEEEIEHLFNQQVVQRRRERRKTNEGGRATR